MGHTNTSPLSLKQDGPNVTVPLIVRPHAKQNAISGIHDRSLRVDVTSAPDRGAANDAIVRLFSQLLSKPRSEITILRGHTSRRKLLLLYNFSICDMLALLEKILPQ